MSEPDEHHRAHRADDWDTSVEAGESTDPKGECRQAVYMAHLDNPEGLTDDEMGRIVNGKRTALGLSAYPVDSMRKRRTDLYHDGLVDNTGERRPSAETGRTMIVWKLIPAGGTPTAPYQSSSEKHYQRGRAEVLATIAALRHDLAIHLAVEGAPVEVYTPSTGWRDVIDYLPEEAPE